MGNFYFEQLLNTALGGIDGSNIMSTVLEVAASILLLSFLYSAYEAFASGGDVRALAGASAKYLLLGLIFATTARSSGVSLECSAPWPTLFTPRPALEISSATG